MMRPPMAAGGGLSSAHAPALDLPGRFLLTGLAALALIALTAPWTVPLLAQGFYSPRVIAFVHWNTLGFIAMIVLGASYQFVPVVLQTPLASVRAGRLSYWVLQAGLVTFLAGLVWLAPPLLAAGGALLLVAVLLYAGTVARTFRRAPRQDVVTWHVFAATAGLVLAASLGLVLAVSKGSGLLGGNTLPILAAHAVLMLTGWVAVLLTGVAYRLVGMFTLAEHALWGPGAWIELGATAGGALTLATSLALGLGAVPSVFGAVLILAGLGLYSYQLVRLYRRRLRRSFDIHMPFALTSAVFGIVTAALLVGGLAGGVGASDRLWTLVGWLAIAGFIQTAIQGFLYKVATFLVWLHRYAPVAGRQPVPKLEDLYSRRLAIAGWALWSAGVLGVGAVIAAAAWNWASAAGLLWALGGAAFVANLVRVAWHWRRPARVPAAAEQQPAIGAG